MCEMGLCERVRERERERERVIESEYDDFMLVLQLQGKSTFNRYIQHTVLLNVTAGQSNSATCAVNFTHMYNIVHSVCNSDEFCAKQ